MAVVWSANQSAAVAWRQDRHRRHGQHILGSTDSLADLLFTPQLAADLRDGFERRGQLRKLPVDLHQHFSRLRPLGGQISTAPLDELARLGQS